MVGRGAVPEDSSLPAPLRARLADYRDVLALSREALALEDVPEDLLTSVLAEFEISSADVIEELERRFDLSGLAEKATRGAPPDVD